MTEKCPHCQEDMAPGTKLCKSCKLPVKGWRRYFLQPFRVSLELAALIASFVAILSLLQTNEQIAVQREANEKTQIQIGLTERSLDQADSNIDLLREELAELRRANDFQQAQAAKHDIEYFESNRPIVLIGKGDCKIAGNEQTLYVNIENAGKRIAEAVVIKIEVLDTTNWISSVFPPDTVGRLTAGEHRVLTYLIRPREFALVRIQADWLWKEMKSTSTTTKYLVTRQDSLQRLGCDCKSMNEGDGNHNWNRVSESIPLNVR